MVRLAVPLSAGMACAFAWAPGQWIATVSAVLAALIAIFLGVFWQKWKNYGVNPIYGLLLSLCFFFFGYFWAAYQIDQRDFRHHFNQSQEKYVAHVTALPIAKPNSTQLALNVFACEDSSHISSGLSANILAYLHPDLRADTLQPGDQLIYKSRPQPHNRPRNPEQFDFGKYLIGQGYIATVYLKDGVSFSRPSVKPFIWQGILEMQRQRAIELFAIRGVSERELGVVSALVLGKRDMVDPHVRTAFANAGTVHILAVSGLHVGIVYLFISWVLGKLAPGRRMRFVRLVLALTVLWLYAGITGFSPSVLRAATMFSFIALGKDFRRFGNVYNMLAASAFVLLLFNPFLLTQVGFQLSYLAVLGIVSIYPLVYPFFQSRWWWLDKVWALVVVSISAQLATFPLTVHYFNQFPNYFLFANLLVIPLATLLLYAGIFTILFSWVPWLSDALFKATDFIARMLNEGVIWFSQLPHPVSGGLYLTMAEALLFYLLVLALYAAYIEPRKGRLRFAQFSLVVFVFLFCFRKMSDSVRSEALIVDIQGYSLLVQSSGKMAFLCVLGDGEMPPEKLLDFNIGSYLLKRGIDAEFQLRRSDGVTVGDKVLMVARDEVSLAHALHSRCAYILIQNQFELLPEHVHNHGGDTVFLFDGAMNPYQRKRMEAILDQLKLPYLSTATSGAIRL